MIRSIIFFLLVGQMSICQNGIYSLTNKESGLCPNEVNYILRANNFDRNATFKGLPSNKEFRITCFDLQKEQTVYEKSLLGQILSVEDATFLYEYKISELSMTPTAHRLFFLVYFDRGRKVIIPDLNSDFNFDNDEIHYFGLAEIKPKAAAIPNDTIKFEYEYAENGIVSKRMVSLMLEPINELYISKQKDGKFHINVKINEYVRGRISINGRIYHYAAQPGGNAKTTFKRFQMHFSDSEFVAPKKFGSEDMINENDTLTIDGKVYSPRFSIFGDTFFLGPVSVNSRAPQHLFEEFSKGTPINAGKLSIEQMKSGRHTIVDFWGTWCGPCVRDIPKLQKLHERFKSSGVNLIGIAVDGDEKKVSEFLKKRKIQHPVIFENLNMGSDWIYKKMNVTVFPTYLILNNEGSVVFSTNSIESLEEKLEKLKNP